MENKGFEDIELQEKAGNSSAAAPADGADGQPAGDGDRPAEKEEPVPAPGPGDHDYMDVVIHDKDTPGAEAVVKKPDGPYAGMGKEELLRYSRGTSWQAARWFILLLLLAGWCVMLAMAIYIIVVTPRCLPWWQTSLMYQIYPKSFKDTNGDGIGDLNGIIEKVDYLSELGVGAVILNSVYKSPQVDSGYDVTDLNAVDPLFGSDADFDALVEALHAKEIKLIMDFVPNHSSDQHEFFQKSIAGESPYLNWYTWADNKNNWLSVYSGEAWTENSQRAQHYLHQFSTHQPDFNLRNEAVTDYLESAFEHWFVKGVDGFSIQGVKYMFETDAFTDDSATPGYVDDGKGDPKQYDSLLHDKSSEFDGLQHDLLKTWRAGIFDQFSTAGTYRVMLSDSDSNASYVRTYYGTEEEPEVDLPMNMNLLSLGDVNGGWSDSTRGTGYATGIEVYELVKEWMENMPAGKWPTFMLGHHGVHRIASRLSPQYAGVANMLLLTLPGTPICYYGDELGMTDVAITVDQVQDIKAKNDMARWETKTRDRQRSPMQWNTEANAGFSNESSTWQPLPPESDWKRVNVETMTADKKSVLSMFRALASLRAEKRTLRQGPDARFVHNTLNVVSYIRELEGELERYFVALNFGPDTSFENDFFGQAGGALPLEGSVVLATDMDRAGERVQLNKLALRAGEGLLVLLDEIVSVEDSNWWYQYFRPAF